MTHTAPKRWSRKRREVRDRGLRWKAFWAAVFFFFLALIWMVIDFAAEGFF